MAEFKEAPAGAPVGEQLLTWVDNRFPASKLYKEHLSEYTLRKTSTGGTSSARWPWWCW